MTRRPTPNALLPRLGLAALLALGSALAGCGGKTPEVDNAEVVTPKAPAEPAKPEAPPAKEAPKG